MEKKNVLTRILAIAGTVLVWLPILAPVLFGLVSLIADGRFRFDYLMPAELFPVILVGGGLLLWAAIRAHARLKLIGWGIGIAVGSLFGGQVFAVVTGLASGTAEAVGWLLAVGIASVIIYNLAIIATGLGGVLLLGDLFKPPSPANPGS